MDGSVNLVSSGAIDVVASGAAASNSRASDFNWKFKGLALQTAPSSVSITDWSLDGALNVTSVGGLTFSIGQTTDATGVVSPAGGLRATDMYMKITDASSKPFASNVVLNDLVLANNLYLQTGAGNDNLTISNSHVENKVYLFGGLGNDLLVVDNSDFGFAFKPIEISWETTEVK